MIAIKIHNNTPSISGRNPAVFTFSRDNPAPIRNNVNVSILRENITILSVTETGKTAVLFKTIARIKNNINQGI